MVEMELIFTTSNGTEIYVEQGNKSEFDFVVRYRELGKRMRTPTHHDIIQDMRIKFEVEPDLTLELRDEIVNIYDNVEPTDYFPPGLTYYSDSIVHRLSNLNDIGEYPIDFIFVITELIFIQEKINYPDGYLTRQTYSEFGDKDYYTVSRKASRT